MTPAERFETLWTDFLEGELSAEGLAELQALLAEQPSLQAEAADLLQTHRLLGLALQDEAQAEAFVQQTLAQAPQSDAAFTSAVMRQVRATAPARAARAPAPWRAILAAASGLLIGVVSASVVFAYVGPQRGKAVVLLREGFEAAPAPQVTGLPVTPGVWSGDFCRLSGARDNVQPLGGSQMFQFLRADYDGKPEPRGYVGEIYQLVDLRGLREELKLGDAAIQVSAHFNAHAFPEQERYHGSVSVYALDAETATSGIARVGGELLSRALATTQRSSELLDRDSGAWQKSSTELLLPPQTEFLLVRFAVAHVGRGRELGHETFSGHYMDEVRLTLVHRPQAP